MDLFQSVHSVTEDGRHTKSGYGQTWEGDDRVRDVVTPEPTPSAGLKALRYAENQLGVNKVHEGALRSRNNLDQVLTELGELRDKKRALQASLQDKEMLLSADEWSKHPDMSAARMDKHIRTVYSDDDEIREMRETLAKVSGDIEGLEFDRDIHETDIRIACARLHELGGYLQYLAAIKQAELASKPRAEGDPW